MRTEKEIRDTLNEVSDDYVSVAIKDLGLVEIKTLKKILRWVLND